MYICAYREFVVDLFLEKRKKHCNYRALVRNNLKYKQWNRTRGDSMREKSIEQKLIKVVKAMGGIAPKLTSPGFDGMPDISV